jgi:hypothetical protein
LEKVLKLAYPHDDHTHLKEYYEYHYFGGVGNWEYSNNSEDFGNLPTQDTIRFLTDRELETNSDEKEYPIGFLIDQLNKRAEKLNMKVEVSFKHEKR